MKWNKRFVGIAVIVLMTVTAFPLSARESWNLATLMATIAVQKEARVRFVEEKHFSFMDQDLVSFGMLYYQPPDMLTREVYKPEKQRFVVKGMHLTMEENDESRTVDLSEYPQARIFIDAFRATLMGDIEMLRQLFTVTLEGDAQQWTMWLRPHDAAMSRLVTEILLRGREDRLQNIETRESDGDYSLMRLEYDDS